MKEKYEKKNEGEREREREKDPFVCGKWEKEREVTFFVWKNYE